MEISQSRTQGPNNDVIDSFLEKQLDNYDTQYRFVLIKMQTSNKESHESGRAFKQCMVGRGADADYTIPGKDISRKHCLIYFSQDQLIVRDLYSRSGTFVNGVRIPPFEDFYLREKDVIQVSTDDQIIVHHITNVKMVDPAQPNSSMLPQHEVQCPYCTKQQMELPSQINEIINIMQQLQAKIKNSKADLEIVTKGIEKSATTINLLEQQQKVIFVEPQALQFKKQKQLNIQSGVNASTKLMSLSKNGDLNIDDMVTTKKSQSGWFRFWSRKVNQSQKTQEVKEEGEKQQQEENKSKSPVNESKSVKRSWFGRSKSVALVEPQQVNEDPTGGQDQEKLTDTNKPEKSKLSFFWKSKSGQNSASVPAPEDQNNNENNPEQEKTSPKTKSPRSGIFSKIFSPKSKVQIPEEQQQGEQQEQQEQEQQQEQQEQQEQQAETAPAEQNEDADN